MGGHITFYSFICLYPVRLFLCLSLVSDTAMNTAVQTFLQDTDFISFGYYPEVGLLNMVVTFFTFEEPPFVFIMVVSIYIPTKV